jgi:putative spermidine/putrescine transport system permease protein
MRRGPLGLLATLAVRLLFGAVLIVLLAPLVVVVGGSFSAPPTGGLIISYVEFPPQAWTLDWYCRIPPAEFHALALSIALGIVAAAGACLIGIPAALGVVRGGFPGRSVVAAVVRAPLQIPAVVTGIAFLELFYVVGDWTDINLQGSFAGLAVAHVFLATPFVFGSVAAILQKFNPRLEEAALTLGASRWRSFRRVTLPLIMPGVYGGGLYAFIVSFIDVPVSLFLSEPGLVPYPVELFYAMENEFNPSILASATLVILLSFILLLIMQRLVGLERLLRSSS